MGRLSNKVVAIESRLFDAIQCVGRRELVIVSDRYPPDILGGAEISLHLVAKELAQRVSLVVVALTTRPDMVGLTDHEGVTVIRVPVSANWPIQSWPRLSSIAADGYGLASVREPWGKGLREVFFQISRDDLSESGSAVGHAVKQFLLRRHGAGFMPDAWHLNIIRKLIEACEPRVVHADNLLSILTMAQLRQKANYRLVGQIRDNRFWSLSPIEQSAPLLPKDEVIAERRAALLAYDGIIVASRFLAERLLSNGLSLPIHVVPNAVESSIDVDDWIRGQQEFPGTAIALPGTLCREKGQLRLLEKLPDLLREIPDLVIHLAGKGPDENAVKRLADLSKFRRHVVFHQFLDRRDLYRLLAACQFVVVPSLWPEPSGRIPMEAAMARRAVVAFDSGGLSEQVQHGVTGLLAATGDFEGLGNHIVTLSRNPDLRLSLASRAKQLAESQRDSLRIAHFVYSVYAE